MSKRRRFVVAALLCGVLAPGLGASQAVRENEATAAFMKIEASCTARMAGEALKPLGKRFPITPRQAPSPAMLSSQDKPTAEDRVALRAFAAISEDCNKGFAQVYDKYVTATHATIFRAAAVQRAIMLVQLHNGPLSYGAYNQERKRVQEELLSSMTAFTQAMEAGDAAAGERIAQGARQRYQEVRQRQNQLQQQQRTRKAGSGRCQQIGGFAYCDD